MLLIVLENEFAFLDIVLVFDFTDDLLQHILDGNHARDTTVFIHDHGDVVAAGTEFLEQYVKALALRHKHRGSEDFTNRKIFLAFQRVSQHVLGKQDADHFIAVVRDHRKT